MGGFCLGSGVTAAPAVLQFAIDWRELASSHDKSTMPCDHCAIVECGGDDSAVIVDLEVRCIQELRDIDLGEGQFIVAAGALLFGAAEVLAPERSWRVVQ
jgi:hypothetical protein